LSGRIVRGSCRAWGRYKANSAEPPASGKNVAVESQKGGTVSAPLAHLPAVSGSSAGSEFTYYGFSRTRSRIRRFAAIGGIAGGGRGAATGALIGGSLGALGGAATTPSPGYYGRSYYGSGYNGSGYNGFGYYGPGYGSSYDGSGYNASGYYGYGNQGY
jgi:hypothetical protein